MQQEDKHAEDWEKDDICPNIVKIIKVLSHESKTCIAYSGLKKLASRNIEVLLTEEEKIFISSYQGILILHMDYYIKGEDMTNLL